jgi:hypothetical protein
MRAAFPLIAALGALLLAGCGSGGDDDRKEEARQLVEDGIAAYEQEDYEALCDLSSQEINDGIPQATKQDSCPAGYEELFRRQDELEGERRPFDEFVQILSETEIGEATLTDTGATVALDSPKGEATSYLIEEDGELKIQELFMSENVPAAQGQSGVALGE